MATYRLGNVDQGHVRSSARNGLSPYVSEIAVICVLCYCSYIAHAQIVYTQ